VLDGVCGEGVFSTRVKFLDLRDYYDGRACKTRFIRNDFTLFCFFEPARLFDGNEFHTRRFYNGEPVDKRTVFQVSYAHVPPPRASDNVRKYIFVRYRGGGAPGKSLNAVFPINENSVVETANVNLYSTRYYAVVTAAPVD